MSVDEGVPKALGFPFPLVILFNRCRLTSCPHFTRARHITTIIGVFADFRLKRQADDEMR